MLSPSAFSNALLCTDTRLRWIHECMFSLNLAWTIVWIERSGTQYMGGRVLANCFTRVFHNASPHLATIGGFTILEQMVWSLVLGIIIFASLRMLSRSAFSNALLCTVAGSVAIAGLPVMALAGFIDPAHRLGVYNFGLSLEVIGVLIVAALYYVRRPSISSLLMGIILLLHFCLWAWLTSKFVNVRAFISTLRGSAYYHSWLWTLGLLFISTIFNFGFVVLGFVSSMTWARYVRRRPSEATD
jgi:hypothetical protein